MIFRWAAVAIDAWLFVAPRFRRLWRAVPGDLLAWFVMRACGTKEPRRIGFAEDVSAILVEDPRAGRYLDSMPVRPYAQTIGHYVFVREPIDPYILAHELEHVRQWQRFGPFFLPAYIASSGLALLRGQHPYQGNRFEAAARARAEADQAASVRWLADRTAAVTAPGVDDAAT